MTVGVTNSLFPAYLRTIPYLTAIQDIPYQSRRGRREQAVGKFAEATWASANTKFAEAQFTQTSN